ncbi:MAG TPA: hypothetical protein VHO70_08650 [Chitinispirillaceae bacterium]|nr:hypothetical protein [Chitinispirillaceae bacterium]
MSIKSVLVCISVLFFVVNGFGQGGIYHRVKLGAAGTNGELMIATNENVIKGISACASPYCAKIPIDGTKLPEYLLAFLNANERSQSIPFHIGAGPKYVFEFGDNADRNGYWLWSLEFSYTAGTGTDIKITMTDWSSSPRREGKTGIIRLADAPSLTDQRNVDYMLSILYSCLYWQDHSSVKNSICFDVNPSGVITNLYTTRGTSLSCAP